MNRNGPILVVEDSDEDFETVLDAVRRAGLGNDVLRATSGDACMQLLLEPAPATAPVPALLLMDLNTPKGDGRDALRSIQQDERLRALPCVVLSASANPRDVRYCYEYGANAYHIKPVSHPEHLQLVQDILRYWLCRAALPELGRPPRA